jgi:hypothetical protein
MIFGISNCSTSSEAELILKYNSKKMYAHHYKGAVSEQSTASGQQYVLIILNTCHDNRD